MPIRKDSLQFILPNGKPRCMSLIIDDYQCQLEVGHTGAHYHRDDPNWFKVIEHAKENDMQIEVSFLVNHTDDDGAIRTRTMHMKVDPVAVFGDNWPDVAQINGFFIRLPWQPETPIEFTPRPYWMG